MKENLTNNYIFGGSSTPNLKTEQNTIFCFFLIFTLFVAFC